MFSPALLATLLFSLLLSASPLAPAVAQEPLPAQTDKPLPVAPTPAEIPKKEKERKNPVAATSESVASGRKLFTSQCTMCHGIQGDGKGDLAVELGWTVPDFTSAKMKERTDGELFYILTHGRDHMPGQEERLRETQKWELINFIRSLAPEKAEPEAGKKP